MIHNHYDTGITMIHHYDTRNHYDTGITMIQESL